MFFLKYNKSFLRKLMFEGKTKTFSNNSKLTEFLKVEIDLKAFILLRGQKPDLTSIFFFI